MAEGAKSFDGDLHMFRDTPRVANLAQLRFQRWLIEHGRSEHPPFGPPAGELADGVLAPRVPATATD